jgi:solute carrier family 25 carnitine/acylcarnitine transporter 20/29
MTFWSYLYPTGVVRGVLQLEDFKNPKYTRSIKAFHDS